MTTQSEPNLIDAGLETILAAAEEHEGVRATLRVYSHEEFVCRPGVEPRYIDVGTGKEYSGPSINSTISNINWPSVLNEEQEIVRVAPAKFLADPANGRVVASTTWDASRPERVILDTYYDTQGPRPSPGENAYNLYSPVPRPEVPEGGSPEKWLAHVERLIPEDDQRKVFLDYAAHLFQFTHVKPQFAILLAGRYGSGKDTALLPLRLGIGHNTRDVKPEEIFDKHNGYIQNTFIVVTEVLPHDNQHKPTAFYNDMKELISPSNPYTSVSVKYSNPVQVVNVAHVMLTTNDPSSMHIPEGDRRLYVISSRLRGPQEPGTTLSPTYFNELREDLLENGGWQAVVDYLYERDISEFDVGLVPPSTPAKNRIVGFVESRKENDISQLCDLMCSENGRPRAFFLSDLVAFAKSAQFDDKAETLRSLRSNRAAHQVEQAGFDLVPGPEGRAWRKGKFQSKTAFADPALTDAEQFQAVTELLAARAAEIK